MNSFVLITTIISLLNACADDTAFQGERSAYVSNLDADADAGAGDGDGYSENDTEQDGWNTTIDADSGHIRLTLTLQPKDAPPVDYLFVVDNSTSMDSIITQMQDGFIEIAEKGEFPRNAKIGVISTSTELDVVSSKATVNGKKVKSSNIVGFKELVNRANILNNPDRKSDHGYGCVKGWFSPREKDGTKADNYCLSIATNFKLYGTGYEAGLSSFDNFLNAQADNSPFRKGALLNVVFFSDTHDVGAHNNSLLARRNTYTVGKFFDKAKKSSKISSIKFHGLVPQKGKGKCSKEGLWDYAYSKFIEETKGHQVHCEGANYANFISKMVLESKSSNKILDLPEDFSGDVISVSVEDKDMKFTHDKDNNQIVIHSLNQDFSEAKKVTVKADI